VLDRGFEVAVPASVRERVRRDVEDAHHDRVILLKQSVAWRHD
jgi:hypothetical protein